ncbi:4725_t:CDS:1, partial [Dentiscutata erythropus]
MRGESQIWFKSYGVWKRVYDLLRKKQHELHWTRMTWLKIFGTVR